jgi:hypothetical protein
MKKSKESKLCVQLRWNLKFIAWALSRTSDRVKVPFTDAILLTFLLSFSQPFSLDFINFFNSKTKEKRSKILKILSWCFIASTTRFLFLTSKPHQELLNLQWLNWKYWTFYFTSHRQLLCFYNFKKWWNISTQKSWDDYISTQWTHKRAKQQKH